MDCMAVDPSGNFWAAVLAKAQALHPPKPAPFNEHTLAECNKHTSWGNGGLSDHMATI